MTLESPAKQQRHASRVRAGIATPPGRIPAVPHQLPAAVPYFTGREELLKALTELAGRGAGPGSAAVVCAIGGTAGVGKSALVVHWGQQAADRFPDGQLYVNLRGFDPTGVPLDTVAAMRGFLGAFGIPQAQIPGGLAEQTALYRSMLTGRRMLIVLDNARDPEQIRPLLPAPAGSLVLVTSRAQLTGLVTDDGARPLTVGLLSAPEAHELLERRLGGKRVAAEPDAVARLVELCSGLPLALNIAAARANTYPNFPLAAVAKKLRDARGALSALDTGDATANVRAVISWSYRALDRPAARMFRLLGVHPGPDITAPAAADLASVPLAQAREALDELARAHLLSEHVRGRYGFNNDLLRAFAADLARAHDCEDECRNALRRTLDYYLRRARDAAGLLQPGPTPAGPNAHSSSGAGSEQFTDVRAAYDWLTAEYQVLLACVARAAEAGFDSHAWQLPLALASFLGREQNWHDLADALAIGLEATRRLGDRDSQALAHRFRGLTVAGLGCYPEAYAHLTQALNLAREARDHVAGANTHLAIAWALGQQDRNRRALHHSRRALARYRAAGNSAGQAKALDSIGFHHCRLGDPRDAVTYCQRALDLLREAGSHDGAGGAWSTMGLAHHQLGRYAQAVECLEKALPLLRESGDTYIEAITLIRLGDAHRAAGEREKADGSWREALAFFDGIQHPKAEQVRARLREPR